MKDNSQEVLNRIASNNFKALIDNKGIPLNVSYTEDGLKFTVDAKGKNLYFAKHTKVIDFKPTKELVQETSFKSKCYKRWIDKANSMCYDQRFNWSK